MPAVIVPKSEPDKVYRDELLAVIQAKIDEHPRSSQVEIGPSEIGGCMRKVAWKLAYGGASDREGGWAAHKGTLVHAWLDETFSGADRFMPDGSPRFFSDLKLPKSNEHVNGGTLDLYDLLHQIVIDFKAPGDWTMKAVRSGAVSEGYYVQIMVYAYGLERQGLPVQRVALLFLPMAGDDLHGVARGAILLTWPYDRQVALDAFAGVERIKNMLAVAPVSKVLAVMETKADFCSSCPAFTGNGDRRAMCPGVIAKPVKQESTDPFRLGSMH